MREIRWLLRAKRWAQNPPSEARVKFVLGIVAVVLIVAGIEHFFGWPDWAGVDAADRRDILR